MKCLSHLDLFQQEQYSEKSEIQKASSDYLSKMDGKFSWKNTSDGDHKAGLGKIAVNDPAESCFGATTW